MTDSHGLVVVSLEPWDQVWRRNQYLVAGLLRTDPDLRILFVEPPSDMAYAALRRSQPRRGRGLRPGPDLDGVEADRLWLYEPTKLAPRRVAPGYDARRARRIVHAAHRLGFDHPTLWINDLGGSALLRSGLPSLYDVTDDWLAADRPAPERDRLARDERALLDGCDVVTVCSPNLALTKGTGRSVQVITNGVDAARYAEPQSRPHDLPPGRIALYVGTLHADRLDVELCVATSDALDGDGTLVLVGPAALEPDELHRLSEAGVVVLGARPAPTVPAYLQHADVLVVPHVVDAFTDSLDPIKLYEYLAVGRPVVSTAVAGFRDAPEDRVMVAAPDAFPGVVAETATARPRVPSTPPPADLPTWTSQTALMRDALAEARARRHPTPR
ncbi:MAG TPA: glycosyltransferase [Luteimicrobium sp.]|nr:glycosyltransferase [Luteimicrobium sp.]